MLKFLVNVFSSSVTIVFTSPSPSLVAIFLCSGTSVLSEQTPSFRV